LLSPCIFPLVELFVRLCFTPPCFRRTSQRSSKRKLDHSELRNESSHKTKAGPFEVSVWTARDVSKAVRMIQQVFPYHRTRNESLTLKFILTICLSVNCSQVLSKFPSHSSLSKRIELIYLPLEQCALSEEQHDFGTEQITLVSLFLYYRG